ncbi:MAG: hypothetical protein KY428_07040, partial [Bacteroidetes bacterium]|nr:hypothetical protein [Bacteroidota bacterium]
MRKLLLILCLFLPAAFAAAQGVNTRNDYTGSWSDRSTWTQNWVGILQTNPLPVSQTAIYGYVVLGANSASLSLELSGTSSLTVHDTLRIHGNLRIGANAVLTLEANAILIVHGDYEQLDGAQLNNKGKLIVREKFTISNFAGETQNTGHSYAGEMVSTGQAAITVKTLAALATEDAYSSYFSVTNLIDRHCQGSNSGTLTYSGTASSVVRWESSTDYFKNNIQTIANTTTQYTYSNLSQTTSYRVYYRTIGGGHTYSNGATILVVPAPLGGTISGPSEFCGSASSVTLSLENHTAHVKRWEWSTNNFASAPQSIATTEESLTL